MYQELVRQYVHDSMLAWNVELDRSVRTQIEALKAELPWVTDQWCQENLVLHLRPSQMTITDDGKIRHEGSFRLALKDV